MVQYRLLYFNGRGRAEVARLIFAAAGQEYEDVRYEREEWPQHKANTPFGQVPVLEVRDGDKVTVLGQSNAICRFLATRFNLVGATDLDRAREDMVVDQLNDLVTAFSQWKYYETNEERKKELAEKLFTETVPTNVRNVERLLEQCGTPYIAGNELTWADLALSVGLDYFGARRDEFLENAPLIRALDERVRANSNVAAWLEKRPVTEF